KPGTGGDVTLYANDEQIGEGRIPRTVPLAFTSYSGMDVGRDNGLVVDRAYEDKAPYAFTGTVKNVVFDLKPTSHEDEKALHEAPRPATPAPGGAAEGRRGAGGGRLPRRPQVSVEQASVRVARTMARGPPRRTSEEIHRAARTRPDRRPSGGHARPGHVP